MADRHAPAREQRAATSDVAKLRKALLADPDNLSYHKKRAEVVAAAAAVFMAKGFTKTTLADIADHLNIERATMYYYCGSKAELLEEAVSASSRRNLRRIEAIHASPVSAVEKLRTLTIAIMESYAEDYPAMYVFVQENLSRREGLDEEWAREMQQLNRDYQNIVVDIIVKGQADGTVRADLPAQAIAFGVIGIAAWTNRWFNPGHTTVSANQIGVTYADLIATGIAADTPTAPSTDGPSSTESLT